MVTREDCAAVLMIQAVGERGEALAPESCCYKDDRTLEALRESGDFERMRGVFAGFFAAQARSRKNLAGIRKLQRIEGAADALHGGEVRFGEHFGHHALFFFADAVFPGNGAASGKAEFQDFHRKRERSFFLPINAPVIKNQRMKISVARMKNVGD